MSEKTYETPLILGAWADSINVNLSPKDRLERLKRAADKATQEYQKLCIEQGVQIEPETRLQIIRNRVYKVPPEAAEAITLLQKELSSERAENSGLREQLHQIKAKVRGIEDSKSELRDMCSTPDED